MNPDQQLINYISNSLASGVQKEKIINELLQVGWDKQVIENAFNIANNSIKKTQTPQNNIQKLDQSTSTNTILNDNLKTDLATKSDVSKLSETVTESTNNENKENIEKDEYSELRKQLENATLGTKEINNISVNTSQDAQEPTNIYDDNQINIETNYQQQEVDLNNSVQNINVPYIDQPSTENFINTESANTANAITDSETQNITNETTSTKPKSKFNIRIIIFILIISLIIILSGALTFLYIQSNKNQVNEDNQASTELIEQDQEIVTSEDPLQIDSNYIVVFTTTQEFNYKNIPSISNQDNIDENYQNEQPQIEQQGAYTTDINEDQDIQLADISINNNINKEEISLDLRNGITLDNQVLGIQDIRNLELENIRIGGLEELSEDKILSVNDVREEYSINLIAQNTSVEDTQDTQDTLNQLEEDAQEETLTNIETENEDSNLLEETNTEDLIEEEKSEYNTELNKNGENNESNDLASYSDNNMDLFFYDIKNNRNLKVSETIENDDNYLYSLGQWSKNRRYLPIMGMSKDDFTGIDIVNLYLYDAQNNSATKIYTEPYNNTQSIINEFGFDFNATWVTDDSFKLIPDEDATISSKKVTSINTIGEISIEEQNKVQQINIEKVAFKYNENTKDIEGNLIFDGEEIEYETKPNDYYLGSNENQIILVNRMQGTQQSSILVINTTSNIVTSYPVIIENFVFLSAQYNEQSQDVIIHMTDNLDNPSTERFISLDINSGQFTTLFEQQNSYISEGLVNQEFFTPYSSFNLGGEGKYIISKRAYSTIITQGIDIYAKSIETGTELEICTIVCNDYTVL